MILDDGIDILLMAETWLYAQAMKPVLLKWRLEVMCHDRSLEQDQGVEVLPSLFGTLSVTVHLSNPCPFSLSRPSSFVSPAGTCPYRLCACTDPSQQEEQTLQSFVFPGVPEFLTQFAGSHSDLVLLGDFNFQYDDCTDTQVNRLKTMLSDHSLTQLVDIPTHRCGHTLDWAVVRSDVSCLVLERVDDMLGISDHRSLLCQTTITEPSKSKRTVTSQNTKAVSLLDFQADVKCFADRYSVLTETLWIATVLVSVQSWTVCWDCNTECHVPMLCWWRMNKLRRLGAFAVSPLWSLDISWCVLYDWVKYFHYTRRVTSKHGVRSKSDCQLFVSTVFFSNHAVIQASTAV